MSSPAATCMVRPCVASGFAELAASGLASNTELTPWPDGQPERWCNAQKWETPTADEPTLVTGIFFRPSSPPSIRAAPRPLAHHELLDLAGHGHREFVDEFDIARDLVVRDLALQKARTSSAVSVSPGRVLIQAQSSSP